VHLRLRDVANLIGVRDPSNVAHWEKGRKVPTLRNALKLSAAIGAPVEVLYSDLLRELRREISGNQERSSIRRTYD
jgi:transcriptional regulator with XRE-family HTH domain